MCTMLCVETFKKVCMKITEQCNYKLLDEDVEKCVRGSRGEALGEEAIRVRQMEWEHSWLTEEKKAFREKSS